MAGCGEGVLEAFIVFRKDFGNFFPLANTIKATSFQAAPTTSPYSACYNDFNSLHNNKSTIWVPSSCSSCSPLLVLLLAPTNTVRIFSFFCLKHSKSTSFHSFFRLPRSLRGAAPASYGPEKRQLVDGTQRDVMVQRQRDRGIKKKGWSRCFGEQPAINNPISTQLM